MHQSISIPFWARPGNSSSQRIHIKAKKYVCYYKYTSTNNQAAGEEYQFPDTAQLSLSSLFLTCLLKNIKLVKIYYSEFFGQKQSTIISKTSFCHNLNLFNIEIFFILCSNSSTETFILEITYLMRIRSNFLFYWNIFLEYVCCLQAFLVRLLLLPKVRIFNGYLIELPAPTPCAWVKPNQVQSKKIQCNSMQMLVNICVDEASTFNSELNWVELRTMLSQLLISLKV